MAYLYSQKAFFSPIKEIIIPEKVKPFCVNYQFEKRHPLHCLAHSWVNGQSATPQNFGLLKKIDTSPYNTSTTITSKSEDCKHKNGLIKSAKCWIIKQKVGDGNNLPDAESELWSWLHGLRNTILVQKRSKFNQKPQKQNWHPMFVTHASVVLEQVYTGTLLNYNAFVWIFCRLVLLGRDTSAHFLHRWWVNNSHWSNAIGQMALHLAVLLADSAPMHTTMDHARVTWRVL